MDCMLFVNCLLFACQACLSWHVGTRARLPCVDHTGSAVQCSASSACHVMDKVGCLLGTIGVGAPALQWPTVHCWGADWPVQALHDPRLCL